MKSELCQRHGLGLFGTTSSASSPATGNGVVLGLEGNSSFEAFDTVSRLDDFTEVGFGLKNMGSAQLDPLMLEGQEISASIDLKQQVAERLAAHRERRSRGMVAAGSATATKQPATSRPNAIAAAVAERFAHTPSYRAVLAEQAQRAIAHAAREAEKAAADAEVAARNAQAIAHTQQRLIDELELWNAPQAFNG